jgi:general secretion pathway protein L
VTEQLVIRVGQSQQDPVQWLIFSVHDEQIIASGELTSSDKISQLADKASSRETMLLLPSSQVQLKVVALPTKWNRKLEQALPFMLEEQLACDVDDVFIAIGKPIQEDEQHSIQIALCDQVWLKSWIEFFTDADIELHRITPDALLLPQPEQGILAMVELGEQWLCRFGQWHISAIEKNWGADYLHALAPEKIEHYSPADSVPDVAPKIAKQNDYDLPLAIFAKEMKNQSFNLQQGIFAAAKKQPQWWRDWRSGVIAAGIAVLSFVAVKSAQLVIYQSQADEYRAQAVDVYKKAFPGKVVRPHLLRQQIKNELAGLSGEEQGGFLELTDHFVAVYGKVKDFTPETFRYDRRRNELRIRAQASGFQTFGQVKAILEQRGLSVEQGSLNNDGDVVIGEIRLRGES